MARKRRLVIGVDVGTGSARAGVFDLQGAGHGCASHPIRLWKPQSDFVEQSSEDIWRACGQAVAGAMREAGAKPEDVAGLSFDATCSLVCLDRKDKPLTVSPTGRHEQNIIVWMDHRALEQARRINETNHKVLKYVGGVISPEMQTPKLLWLKEHIPKSWFGAGRFFDLPDYLTWRATDSDTRSLCTTVCKWTYQGHAGNKRGQSESIGRWDDGFFRHIGLGEIVDDGYARIGQRIRPMGEALGSGLTESAARELHLAPGTPVGVGIIDAHAGGLGVIGATLDGEPFSERTCLQRLALIGGTSNCHMAVSPKARFVGGVWGPYYSAMIPGYWLTEGGQSATGALIDHVIQSSAHASTLGSEAKKSGKSVYELLNERVARLARGGPAAMLTGRLHILGDHHGNRSPRANPLARGMASGLTLQDDVDGLALQYLAAVQAVAYGTRHILEALNDKGYEVRHILACGGGTKNPLFLREHADITGCRIHLPREPEAVLLGAAALGAVACGAYADIPAAMSAMNRTSTSISPAAGEVSDYHNRKYKVYWQMYADQVRYDKMMGGSAAS